MVEFELILIIILSGISIFMFLKFYTLKINIENHIKENEKEIRKDAINRSGRVLSGKILEKLIPFLSRFNHDPQDVRWIGDPIDLIVFDGYSKNQKKDINGITFIEVKSGESKLKSGQIKIRDVIEKGKVKFEEFRI